VNGCGRILSHLRSNRSTAAGVSPWQIPLQPSGVGTRSERIVQRRERDTACCGDTLGPLVAVHTQPGVVREVGTEFQEERTELRIDTVEVIMVDHRGGPNDPRIGRPGHRVTALLGPEHPGPLLRLPDEQHPLQTAGGLEGGQVLVRHVVLTLPLLEGDHRHPLIGGEPLDRGHEPSADRVHQRRRREPGTPMTDQEPRRPARVLQPRLVHVQVQPVDALHLQHHMIGEDIGDSPR
jgi:hypothetical protein